MRWLYHALRRSDVGWGSDGRYRAPSLATEGFIHCSYRDAALESARLYLPPGEPLAVLAIDPRRLDVPIDVAATPRGPMPHVRGAIPADAVRMLSLDAVESAPDAVTGTRIGFVAFDGMTLLDLVGPLDVLSRIASMGFDPTTTCEVIALTRPETDPTVSDVVVWEGSSASFRAARYRPALDVFDVLVIPGGPAARALAESPEILRYLASYPDNRILASVCTGSLLLGAIGRLDGRPATTHRTALRDLGRYGATAHEVRVVESRNIVTAAGVTAGLDLGLNLVRRLFSEEVAEQIGQQIELPGYQLPA